MKILFDSQIFDWQISGGISRYFTEVIRRVEKGSDAQVLFNVTHSYNTFIQHTPWLRYNAQFRHLHFKKKLGLLKVINEMMNRPYSNRLLQKSVPDIFHPTYYDPYFLKYLGKIRFVLTVHDLINEKYDDGSPLTRQVLEWKKKLIDRADHIIAVSENTRQDVISYYKVPETKITTIHLASGLQPATGEKEGGFAEAAKLPQNYILFVGIRRDYKNFSAFVQEVAPVLKKESIALVTAGGGPMEKEYLHLFKQTGIENQVYSYPYIKDAFLAHLYRQALVFVFPSLYEGFGMPALEAMQQGCPVLLSNSSSLPEVGGETALYFNPLEKGDLQYKLHLLISDSDLRERLKGEGIRQSERFNWDNTSFAHVQVYKNL